MYTNTHIYKLQCLSNTYELSGYFVSGEYEGDLDTRSKSCQLAKDYAALTKDCESESESVLSLSMCMQRLQRTVSLSLSMC
jgi:hypothetical protein